MSYPRVMPKYVIGVETMLETLFGGFLRLKIPPFELHETKELRTFYVETYKQTFLKYFMFMQQGIH